MKSIHPFTALAGAAVIFAAGYAWGAATSDSADPFMNTKLLATSGMTFVEGPEAEPPPWPANAPQTVKAAVAQHAAMTSAPQSAVSSAAPPPETERVVPGAAPSGDDGSLAMNDIPSSATAPIYHPPDAPDETEAQAPDGTQRVPRRLRAHPAAQKQITFGTKRSGQPVTIIWDTR